MYLTSPHSLLVLAPTPVVHLHPNHPRTAFHLTHHILEFHIFQFFTPSPSSCTNHRSLRTHPNQHLFPRHPASTNSWSGTLTWTYSSPNPSNYGSQISASHYTSFPTPQPTSTALKWLQGGRNHTQNSLPHNLQTPGAYIPIDTSGPLTSPSLQGNSHILVVIDTASRVLHLAFLKYRLKPSKKSSTSSPTYTPYTTSILCTIVVTMPKNSLQQPSKWLWHPVAFNFLPLSTLQPHR